MIEMFIFTVGFIFFIVNVVVEHRKAQQKSLFLLSGYYAMAIASLALLILEIQR